MNPLVGKVIADIARALGKAVLAGVGLELAKVASDHVKRRLGPKKADGDDADEEPDLEAENQKLKAEIEKLRDELAAAKAPADNI